MKIHDDISAVILSAGYSTRMKTPKAFLKFDQNKTFLEHIIETYILSGISNIILVINPDLENHVEYLILKNKYEHYIKLVVNHFAERGRFYSLKLGLLNTEHPYTFLQNIDNPFISMNLLESMINVSGHSGLVVPACHGRDGHPLLLSKFVVNTLLNHHGNDFNLKIELNQGLFKKVILDWPDKHVLMNINTEDEYQKYFLTCWTSTEY
jgi:CTP:molybdopterin cytidylyltransferase MocA